MKYFWGFLLTIGVSFITACDNSLKENMCYYSKGLKNHDFICSLLFI